MSDPDLARFLDLARAFNEAMLVTSRGGELRSRPMAIGNCTNDGRMRFITRDDSGKLSELDTNSKVNAAMQGDGTFLSLSGNARVTKDPGILDDAWNRHQRVWFAEGRDDAHLVAVEIIPTYAEYWDRRSVGILTLALEQLRHAATGETAPEDGHGREHGEVDFRDRPI